MFKNLIPYKFSPDDNDFSVISKALKTEKKLLFNKIEDSQSYACGFSHIVKDNYIIETDNRILLKVIFSHKSIKKSTIDSKLEERLDKIKEENKTNEISKHVADIYKYQVEAECLRFAPITSKEIYILIDNYTNYIYVSAATTNVAEEALNLLRKLIGKLVCHKIGSNLIGDKIINHLCFNGKDLPAELFIDDYPLISANDKNSVKVKIDGMHKNDPHFLNILMGLSVRSIDMSLVNIQDKNDCQKLASFAFCPSNNGIFIFKNFNYDLIDGQEEYTDYDDSYFYTSKMILIGKYMNNILLNLNLFCN
ncbi:recombination-associated protein RdgC (plasmid) [Orbus sturtevantii]|uniref:recombination-associated protein RdgC n=1 Tax=Orbus sturtevantii TaxID=3074109 RepID=UPI00370D14C1